MIRLVNPPAEPPPPRSEPMRKALLWSADRRRVVAECPVPDDFRPPRAVLWGDRVFVRHCSEYAEVECVRFTPDPEPAQRPE